MVRVVRIELTSSAWKADIISHYTIPAYGFQPRIRTSPSKSRVWRSTTKLAEMVGNNRIELFSCVYKTQVLPLN